MQFRSAKEKESEKVDYRLELSESIGAAQLDSLEKTFWPSGNFRLRFGLGDGGGVGSVVLGLKG